MCRKLFCLLFFVLILGMAGSASAELAACDPSPVDEMTNVPCDVILGWRAGNLAVSHDVYLGIKRNDVEEASREDQRGVLVEQDYDSTIYDPGKCLAFGQTYYWRIDGVTSDDGIQSGPVWSFTVEPIGYPISGDKIKATASSCDTAGKGPEKTIDRSGLDENDLHSVGFETRWQSDHCGLGEAWIKYEFDQVYKLSQMWVWNHNISIEDKAGHGIKDATLEFSLDGVNWTGAMDVQFAQATSADDYAHNTEVNLHVAAKYVRITANSNYSFWGTNDQYGLSEVRFLYSPVWPGEPEPASGTTDLDPRVVLSWRASREADSHNFYLDLDEQAVINRTAPLTNLPLATYSDILELGRTYYWCVDEVNNFEVPPTWPGNVWNFSIIDHLLVEDMEGTIDAWIPSGGATAAVSSDIVHSGSQALALSYDNTIAGCSEITADTAGLANGSDWSIGAPTTLVLNFSGDLSNIADQLYARIGITQGLRYCTVTVPYDNADRITTPLWTQWNVDITALCGDLDDVTDVTIGVGNPTGTATGSLGVVYLDNMKLYRVPPALPQEEIWLEAEAPDMIASPMEIYYDPTASGSLLIGTDDGTGDSSSEPPAPLGTASYNFTVAGGTYKVLLRTLVSGSNDSFWVRIAGATTQTSNHSSGWIRMDGIPPSETWRWDDVFSNDDPGDPAVLFTMPAGTYTLDIGYGEDGALLDVIVITDNLN